MDKKTQDELKKLEDGFFFDDPTDDDDIFEELTISNKIYDEAMTQTEKRPVRKVTREQDLYFDDITSKGSGSQKKSEQKEKETERKTPREYNTAGTSLDRNTIEKEKAKSKKSKIKKIIFWTILEILTLGLIFGYGYFLRNWNRITRPEINEKTIENNNLSAEKKEEMERGYWTIAVFGVDGRSASAIADKGLNSDVIIICNINKENGDIKLVSVFRDTLLNISEKNTYAKANAAYSIGGPEQALAALNKNLDLNIKSYVAVNWKAVADGINILGGVENIPISKAELYYINAYITETVKSTGIGSYQLTSTGEQHLDGVQAVAYARLRNMDNDYARTERQKRVIKACFEKAKTAGFSVLNNIMVVCFPQVATNIDLSDCVAMAQNITKYNIAETGGFPWQRGEATIGNKGDCVIPATLESNVKYLHAFLFGDEDYQPSDAVCGYSENIKSLSGVYKEGQVVKSVRTDSGIIPRSKKSEEEGQSDSDNVKKTTYKLEVDEDGNYIYPTDEDGNIILPTDEDGKIIYQTDEDGNILLEYSDNERPTDEEGNYYDYERPYDPDDIDSQLYEEAEYMINPDGSISKKITTVNPLLDSDEYYEYEDTPGGVVAKPKTGYVTDRQGEMPTTSAQNTTKYSTRSTATKSTYITDPTSPNGATGTGTGTGTSTGTNTGTNQTSPGASQSPYSTSKTVDTSGTRTEQAYNSGSTSPSPGDYTRIGGDTPGAGPTGSATNGNITDSGPGSIDVSFNAPSIADHP